MPTFEEIKAECLKDKKLFKDPDFPADDSILYFYDNRRDVVWQRPQEILKSEQPVFFHDATYYDINQGYVGDCYFLCAVNCLMANDRESFDKVMPRDQSFQKDYAGIFRFNFWQCGDWKEIYVDDRLPTRDGQLIYCYNDKEPNEFWVCLLEKAYAKLHGSYTNLDGGVATESIVDLTGAVSEYISFADVSNVKTLFNLMDKMWKMDTLMTTGIDGDDRDRPDGLIEAHAYAVTSLAMVTFDEGTKRLIRLRNPHGHGEWKKDWSDRSKEWKQISEEDKKKYGVTIRDEGEFWMALEDVMKVFNVIGLCHMNKSAFRNILMDPDTPKAKWVPYIFKDRWVNGISTGGDKLNTESFWRNPQYILDLSKRTENTWVVISLMGKMPRKMANPGLSIGFQMFKMKAGLPVSQYDRVDPYEVEQHSGCGPTRHREHTKSLELSPGTYVLIVYNVEKVTKDYLLRIYSECNIAVRAVDDVTFPPPSNDEEVAEDHLQVAFEKYCDKTERNVDAAALRSVVLYALRKEHGIYLDLSLESVRSLMTFYRPHHSGLFELNCVRNVYASLIDTIKRFLTFDQNNSMSIEIGELINLVESFGVNIGRKVAESLVNRYAGRDGVIDFDDLIQCLCRIFSLHISYNNIGLTENIVSLSEFISETVKA